MIPKCVVPWKWIFSVTRGSSTDASFFPPIILSLTERASNVAIRTTSNLRQLKNVVKRPVSAVTYDSLCQRVKGHHTEPPSPGQWRRHGHDHVFRPDRERYDLVDDRRDLATRTPRARRGRLVARLEYRGGDQHQRPVRLHLHLGRLAGSGRHPRPAGSPVRLGHCRAARTAGRLESSRYHKPA
jgi:hypothetical protein